MTRRKSTASERLVLSIVLVLAFVAIVVIPAVAWGSAA